MFVHDAEIDETPFSFRDIKFIITKLKKNKAYGMDQIPTEIWIYLLNHETFSQLFLS